MAGAPRPRGDWHTGVPISELHRREVDGPDEAPADPPPAPRSDTPRMTFADGESRSWKDLELSPDATRDGSADRPGGPDDLGVRPERGGPETGRGGPEDGPDDGPGTGPDRSGGPDGADRGPGDGPADGPADDGEPDGPWRRTGPDSGDGPYEPDVTSDTPGDRHATRPDGDADRPDGAEPGRPTESADTPETETDGPANGPADATEAPADGPADAADAASIADTARSGALSPLGLPGATGPVGVRDAQAGPPERPGVPGVPGVPTGTAPVPDAPPAPDVPAFPMDQAPPAMPDAVRPVADGTPVAPSPDRPPAPRTPPPDRPAEHRDPPPDDRLARRVREAADAREAGAEAASETGPDRALAAAPSPPCVPEPPAYVNYGRDGIARKDAYIDAAKRCDEALRVGVPGTAYETELVRAYAARLRDRVAPAVRVELTTPATEAGVDGAEVEVADAGAITDRVRSAVRAGYQVGDVTDAIRARIEVAGPAGLPALLDAAERHFGTGDRGRILEIRPNPADVRLTIATTEDGHRYAYELRLAVSRFAFDDR